MPKIGDSIELDKAPEAEQRLLRLLLHELGFKINAHHDTGVYHDEAGRVYFWFPEAFWIRDDEFEVLHDEFRRRLSRA
jgi:hypothetical protein